MEYNGIVEFKIVIVKKVASKTKADHLFTVTIFWEPLFYND